MPDAGCRMPDAGCRMPDAGCRMPDAGCGARPQRGLVPPPGHSNGGAPMRHCLPMRSFALYAVCVLIWGTTWYPITAQIAILAPEVGVAIRFGLAALLLAAFC